MNPVLMLTLNNFNLTRQAMDSIANQNIPTLPMIVDNGSTDGTQTWALSKVPRILFKDNHGVSHGWNAGLDFFFSVSRQGGRFEHVLVVNNDVILPPWFYRDLLSYDAPFVTGISVDNMELIRTPREKKVVHLQPCPDFSAFLIRREVWEKVGQFDESMKFYAQDIDYHIRAVKLGIPLLNADVPFYHERSSTLRNAEPIQRSAIEAQANMDRQRFAAKYGFQVGSVQHHKAVGFNG